MTRIAKETAIEQATQCRGHQAGFSLAELLIVLVVFFVFSAAAVSLVRQHIPLFASQQSQSSLNFSMRNAAAQMQIDIVNAGNGFYTGADVAGWPVGVTINNTNAANTNCYNATTKTYGPGCFDSLTVIATARNTAPANIVDSSGNPIPTSSPVSTSTATDLYLKPSGTMTAAALAAALTDTGGNPVQILIVTGDGTRMTTAILTGTPSVTGGIVHIQHRKTQAVNGGTDESGGGGYNNCPNRYDPVTCDDPLGISTGNDGKDQADPTKHVNHPEEVTLTDQFDSTSWVLKLAPITYDVDASDPANPKLRRTDPDDCKSGCTIAEQIIGFKVGASVWNSTKTDDTTYSYNSSADYSSIWSNVRAVRLTLIGRTDPNGATANFTNAFDGGNYRIEALSVVINPRNLSMNDR